MKKQNGITMISLIITIIVMLILAAVAVSMVVGDDAVIEQAKGATASQNQANAESEIQRAWAAAELDYWTDHSDVSKAEFFAAHLGDYVSSGSVTAVDYVEDGISKITYKDVTGASFTVEVATAKTGGTSSLPSPVAPGEDGEEETVTNTTGSTSDVQSPVAKEDEEETTTTNTTTGTTSGVESPVAKEETTTNTTSGTSSSYASPVEDSIPDSSYVESPL